MTTQGLNPLAHQPEQPSHEETTAGKVRRHGPLAATALVVLAGMAGGGIVAGINAATEDDSVTVAQTTGSAATGGGGQAEATEVRVGTADYSELYTQVSKGVVSVRSTIEGRGRTPFGGRSDGVAGGSGFVVDRKGTILTNQHVVDGASRVDVTFADGTSVQAKVVGEDAASDVAVLDVDVSQDKLSPLKLTDSSKVKVGEAALAIGDPYGYTRTLTVGVVSGLDRSIEAPNGFTISGAIQTDAPINSGNSGGPLVNAKGEVIGINAQIAGSANQGNVGIGFAVSSNTANRVMSQITSDGTAESAWLGVSLDSVDGALAKNVDVGGAESGALITGVVSDGPAAKAGITGGSRTEQIAGQQRCVGGDVVTTVDGQKVANAADLQRAVAAKQPGDRLTLDVTHANGEKDTVTVELASQPEQAPEAAGGC